MPEAPITQLPRPIFRVSSKYTSNRISHAKYVALWVQKLDKHLKTKASHILISTFCFYIKFWLRHVFTCAALMLAPQFIVAQICTLGSSTSRIINTKVLLLNLYNRGQKPR